MKRYIQGILICFSYTGGWSFGTQKFKEMSSTRYSRQLFVLSSIPYLRERNFDGLDIDWEYPKGSEDKANYVLLLRGKGVFVVRSERAIWLGPL